MMLALCLTSACVPTEKHDAASPTNAAIQSCPLGVRGAAVAATDTADGITLTFTTDVVANVEELRTRARDAAAMHGPGEKVGLGHDGRHGEGGQHGLQTLQLPPVHAAEDDVNEGARIRFVPADQKDLEVLRTKLRARAIQLNSTPCK